MLLVEIGKPKETIVVSELILIYECISNEIIFDGKFRMRTKGRYIPDNPLPVVNKMMIPIYFKMKYIDEKGNSILRHINVPYFVFNDMRFPPITLDSGESDLFNILNQLNK